MRRLAVSITCWAAACGWAAAQSYSWARDLSVLSFGQAPPARLGGAAGDWDGDGVGDFGVSFGFSGGTGGKMRVYSGFDYGVLAEWIGSVLPAPFGGGWEWPGRGSGFADVDGDGARDLLMSTSESYLGSLPFVGNVRVIAHATASELYTVWGAAASDAFGYFLTVVGDTSGNGVPDFLVYALAVDSPPLLNVGAWYLIEGADGSIRYQWTGTGSYPGELEAQDNGVGDIDGDGCVDIAIARPHANGDTGTVTIHSGLTVPSVIRQHIGTVAGWQYGNGAIFPLGDVDGDGVPDYVIGSYFWGSGTATAPGAAWLYSGATGAVIQTYQGPAGTGELAFAGDRLDDVDGDGVNDLVLGAPTSVPAPGNVAWGRVLAFSSVSGTLLQEIHPPTPGLGPGQTFGIFLRNVEDIDGDGRWDFTAGQAGGPVHVYTRDIVTLSPNSVPIGSTAAFQFTLPAQPGAIFHLCLSGSATAGIPVGTRTFPLDADSVLLATLENPALGGILDATGSATVSIPVPADPSLAGVSLKYAGLTLSPSSPFGVRTIGTAGTVTVQ